MVNTENHEIKKSMFVSGQAIDKPLTATDLLYLIEMFILKCLKRREIPDRESERLIIPLQD